MKMKGKGKIEVKKETINHLAKMIDCNWKQYNGFSQIVFFAKTERPGTLQSDSLCIKFSPTALYGIVCDFTGTISGPGHDVPEVKKKLIPEWEKKLERIKEEMEKRISALPEIDYPLIAGKVKCVVWQTV